MEQQGYEDPAGLRQPSFADLPHDLRLAGRADWRRELRSAILSRVVPRLSDRGRAEPPIESRRAATALAEDDIVRFSELLLAAAVPSLVGHIEALRRDGLSVEAVMLQLMAPAARRLGDLWLEDRLGFFDVTVGLGRLQGVMRALGPDIDGEGPGRTGGGKILLAPVPGEQHVFGLSVVAAFFRRAGWDVVFEPRIGFEDLLDRVRGERFTAVGLSAAGDRFAHALPAQVEALRRASLNGGVALLAGGPAFLLDPDLRERAGVDAVAGDAAEAVRLAEALSGRTAAVCS